MTLRNQISDDMKSSMKSQDKVRTGVLRMLLSEIKYAAVAGDKAIDPTDEDVLRVVRSYHKKLSKSLADFPPGEARQAVEVEIKIVEEYLPKQASEGVLDQVIQDVLAGASDRAFGPLMKAVMAKLGAGADGKAVSERLKKVLASS